jgi:trafficking protein particle complex subunit 2
MTSLFLIVGLGGEPIYELEMGQGRTEDSAHLNQFIAHSALDLVDAAAWTTTAMSLKCVDRFQDKFVSAFLTPGNQKFLLLHDGRNEDSIRGFFLDVHELLIKHLMNPFTEYDTPIVSAAFDKRVRAFAKKI